MSRNLGSVQNVDPQSGPPAFLTPSGSPFGPPSEPLSGPTTFSFKKIRATDLNINLRTKHEVYLISEQNAKKLMNLHSDVFRIIMPDGCSRSLFFRYLVKIPK